MKFPAFDYRRPRTLSEALDCLAEGGDEARPLAGGQSLMPMLAFRVAAPEILVDLNGVGELRGIDLEDGILRIGAMTRYVELESSDLVRRHAPLFTRALPHVAHVAIRNRGTIGGSAALADPAAEMPACLLAMEAEFEIVCAEGMRRVAAEDFFLGLYETAIEPNEILRAVRLPLIGVGRVGFHEITRRHGDYALAGAAALERDGELRVAMFGCDDRPVLARTAAAAVMSGMEIDAAVERLTEDIAPSDTPQGDAWTRMTQAKVAFRRAVADLRGGDNG